MDSMLTLFWPNTWPKHQQRGMLHGTAGHVHVLGPCSTENGPYPTDTLLAVSTQYVLGHGSQPCQQNLVPCRATVNVMQEQTDLCC